MFKEIIKRQLIEDLISFKFLINTIVILCTVVLFSLIFINNYHNIVDDYSRGNISNETTLTSFARAPRTHLGSTALYCTMQPRLELFISEANEGIMPQGFLFSLQPNSIRDIRQEKEVMYTSISKRDLESPSVTFYPDLTFIVQFLLSFFALVLTFNAVSAEKERGTLRLVYSNSIKSGSFILAKYLAAFLAVFIPLLLGLILGLVLLGLFAAGASFPSLALSFLLFLVISMLYLSIFILIGLLFSTISQNSKTSLVLCLLFWVFAVIIIPKSTGAFLNLKAFNVPTEEEISDLSSKAEKSAMERFNRESPKGQSDQEEETKIEMRLKMNSERDKAIQDINDYYLRKKISAITAVRNVNIVSPASLFEYSVSGFTMTGLSHFESVWTRTRQYANEFTSFLRDYASTLKSGSFFYPDEAAVSDKPIDANGIPRFTDSPISSGARTRHALPFVSLLILYNLLLFTVVIYRFQRCDVR